MRQFVKLSICIDHSRVAALQKHLVEVQKLIAEREEEDQNVEKLIDLEHFIGEELNLILSRQKFYIRCEQQLFM